MVWLLGRLSILEILQRSLRIVVCYEFKNLLGDISKTVEPFC